MFSCRTRSIFLVSLIAAFAVVAPSGCGSDRERITDPAGARSSVQPASLAPRAPAGLVRVDFEGRSLRFWPYAGADLSGRAVSPMNLIFFGKASPVQIRAALLALDGTRNGPNGPLFPSWLWTDALGEARTAYIEGTGWTGSVMELQLGEVSQGRYHLWLFQTSARFGSGEVWTLGSICFEGMVPGADFHETLSWELAKQIILFDLQRGGLLDAGTPYIATAPINATPYFGAIPKSIYNNSPPDLLQMIGGPPAPVAAPVSIVSDGRALLFHLAGTTPVIPCDLTLEMTGQMMNVLRRPPCLSSPMDYILVRGPVTHTKRITVTPVSYEYTSNITSDLSVLPIPWMPDLPEIFDDAPTRLIQVSETARSRETGSFFSSVMSQMTVEGGRPEGFTTVLLLTGSMQSCSTVRQCLPAMH